MTLFRLDASIRTDGSVSREVADSLERGWLAEHPGDAVVRRDVGVAPIPADVWATAAAAQHVPADQRTEQQEAAVALAAALADEVLAGDSVVIASPLYNFTVSQHLKTWIDLLVTDPRFTPGQQPLVGRPVALVLARGGGYGPGTPREGWDHATPWLRRIFGDVLGADVSAVAAELTLADVKPAMADLRDLAAQSRTEAHGLAERTGRTLAARALAGRALANA
ncbi:FMN-dependent NADH-azoreductase [Umezawaea beigongshangensis]|uniref:FMN-dependent NADH-azoreductase n=1 Tax=Umezawaea beigongshangensis TaxID=2780383 RepID=UPI0018F12D5E|nr:NAD(P)H-dependent oxidoreductase [Umezawaea beigongshangensis]